MREQVTRIGRGSQHAAPGNACQRDEHHPHVIGDAALGAWPTTCIEPDTSNPNGEEKTARTDVDSQGASTVTGCAVALPASLAPQRFVCPTVSTHFPMKHGNADRTMAAMACEV